MISPDGKKSMRYFDHETLAVLMVAILQEKGAPHNQVIHTLTPRYAQGLISMGVFVIKEQHERRPKE